MDPAAGEEDFDDEAFGLDGKFFADLKIFYVEGDFRLCFHFKLYKF